MDLNKIGKYIAKKRQEKGFTQEILAKESCMIPIYLSANSFSLLVPLPPRLATFHPKQS